jgi:hypothetical protein
LGVLKEEKTKIHQKFTLTHTNKVFADHLTHSLGVVVDPGGTSAD